ncbi:MAG: hypothetical protein KKF27_20045, partial [Gammaproteobacteria bacterium]|nr:hypothetical protein [Gammaproteobacteria bacterium]
IKEMSNPELLNVINEIRQIKRDPEGRLKAEVEQAAFDESLERLAYDVVPTIQKGSKEITESARMKAYLERMREKQKMRGAMPTAAKKFLWAQLRAENILEWFNGWKRGPFLAATFDKIKKATESESNLFRGDLETFQKIHEDFNMAADMAGNEITVTAEITDPQGNAETFSHDFTVDEMMFVYAHSQNPNSYRHLVGKISEGGDGFNPMVVDAIIDALPQKTKAAVDAMIDYYDTTVYDRLNETYKKIYGIDMPQEHRYFPLMKLNTDRAENAMVMDTLMRHSSQMRGPEKGMTKERVKSQAPFDRMSYYEAIIENLRAVNHFSAFALPVKEVNAVLNHPDIKAAMKARNEIAYNEVQAWLKRNSYGRISQPGGRVAGLAESLRLSYVPAVLGGNFMTMLKQGASLSIGMDRLQNKKSSMPQAIATWLKNPREMTRTINAKSTFMRDRRDTFQRDFQEMAEKRFLTRILGSTGLIGKSKEYMEGFKRFSLEGIKAIDSVTVNLLWQARYTEVLNEGGNEQVAIDAADELVRKTQPVGGVLNLPSSFTGNAMERMYTMFQNQPNQNLQGIWEMGSRWGEEKTSRNLAKTFWRVALPSAIIYTMSNAFQAPWDDPEGWTKEAVRQIVGGIPVFGQLILAGVDYGLGKVYEARGGKWQRDRFLTDMSPSAFGLLEDVAKVAQNPKVSKAIELAAKFRGLPVIFYNRAKLAAENKSWKYLLFSKSAIRRKGDIVGDMVSRRLHPRNNEDKKKVQEWLDNLSDRKKKEFSDRVKQQIKEDRAENKAKEAKKIQENKEARQVMD